MLPGSLLSFLAVVFPGISHLFWFNKMLTLKPLMYGDLIGLAF